MRRPVSLSPVNSDSLSFLISETMIRWAEEKHVQDASLVREMFRLLHRQYDGVGEVRRHQTQVLLCREVSPFLTRVRFEDLLSGSTEVEDCGDAVQIIP